MPGDFTITDHRFPEFWRGQSPNIGDALSPSVVVVHYTAMPDIDQVERWLCSPASQVSAHLIVGQDGTVRQIVPFDRVAWHAGRSRWQGIEGLNQCSIGIELMNVGWLDRFEPAGCTRDDLDFCLPLDAVTVARHGNGGALRAWQRFPEAQLQALDKLIAALKEEYPAITEVLGHDEIAPDRKEDPGPAFPIGRYR